VEYPIACECGNVLRVSKGAAGTRIACPCGQSVRVPTLRCFLNWDGKGCVDPQNIGIAAGSVHDALSEAELRNQEGVAATVEHMERKQLAEWKRVGPRDVLVGALIFLAALIASVLSYQHAFYLGGRYEIAVGAIIWGGWLFIRGVRRMRL
jgi:hypothetical protein